MKEKIINQTAKKETHISEIHLVLAIYPVR